MLTMDTIRMGIALQKSNEIWKPVVGYEGIYEVSSLGKIRCKKGEKSLRFSGPPKNKRFVVDLYKDGKKRTIKVHVLVLEAFVGPRPTNFYACHNDGNPLNNDIKNLRWDTPKSNSADRLKHGTDNRGEKSPVAFLNESDIKDIKALLHFGVPYDIISRAHKISFQHISDINNNKRWAHIEYKPNGNTKLSRAIKAKERAENLLRDAMVSMTLTWPLEAEKIEKYFAEVDK